MPMRIMPQGSFANHQTPPPPRCSASYRKSRRPIELETGRTTTKGTKKHERGMRLAEGEFQFGILVLFRVFRAFRGSLSLLLSRFVVRPRHARMGRAVFPSVHRVFAMKLQLTISAGGAMVVWLAAVASAAEPPPFAEVRALLAAKCLACHGNDPKELKG